MKWAAGSCLRSRALERVTDRLENGTHATIAEIAVAEKINESYVGRVLRLTLLAPDIVEAILGGGQSVRAHFARADAAVFPGLGTTAKFAR
jgi:hypothetical protein